MPFKSVSRDPATLKRFLKFLLVGLVNTGFGYGVYAILVIFGTPPQIALLLSFMIGVLWNYLTTARFVFEVSGFGRLPAYCLCYVLIYGLNAGTLQLAINTGIQPLLAQAILTPIVAVISFVLLSMVMRERS
jgi:putative flippase GtrA